jgi:hypothetical protein
MLKIKINSIIFWILYIKLEELYRKVLIKFLISCSLSEILKNVRDVILIL